MNPSLGHNAWNQDSWKQMGWLNSGVLYLSRSLELVVYNGLAAELLDAVVPIGKAVPLPACFNTDREEYKVLSSMVLGERELRNHVVTWSIEGSIRHVMMDSFRHEDEFGTFTGIYVVMKDLGDLATLEQHLQKTDKLATVGKIAAGIAHEIRNPLTTIKGFLQVMERRFAQPDKAEELQYTKVMLQEIDRVNALVSELLLLSKPHKAEKSPCSMVTILEELDPLIRSQALLRGVDYDVQIHPLPELIADRDMMKQVLLNLVKNAIEAMENGGVLKVRAGMDGTQIRIDISDTGPGIPYYLMDRIFDAFYTTKDKGTGLGLPICQRIVTEHGGEIRVASKGFGTTFSVLLPTIADPASIHKAAL